MFSIASNAFNLLARYSRRSLLTAKPLARFSTQKGNDEVEPDHKSEHVNHQKPVDKAKMLDKFKNLTTKLDGIKEELEKHQDFEETRASYKKMNRELEEGRAKIVTLIEEGKKHWDKTREKINDTEDKQIIQFVKELQKFNKVMRELQNTPRTPEQEPLLDGILMTQRILTNTLHKFNFKPYQPLKEKYNPAHHIKVGNQNEKGGTVSEVVENGWSYKNKVVIPATVKVSK